MFEMFMSVHNTMNVSKVNYKYRAPILLLPVLNLSSIHYFLPCQHLRLCEFAIIIIIIINSLFIEGYTVS
jgi:hypothetical protein